jgi:hypothetical protein
MILEELKDNPDVRVPEELYFNGRRPALPYEYRGSRVVSKS